MFLILVIFIIIFYYLFLFPFNFFQMDKEKSVRFLARIADEMQFGPERDSKGKIVRLNYEFRRWYCYC